MPWHYWALWIFVALSSLAFYSGIQMSYKRINFLIGKINEIEEALKH